MLGTQVLGENGVTICCCIISTGRNIVSGFVFGIVKSIAFGKFPGFYYFNVEN